MSDVEISGLEAGVISWLHQERAVRAELGVPSSADAVLAPDGTLSLEFFQAQRRSGQSVSDLLAHRTALPVDPSVRISEITLPTVDGEAFGRVYEPMDATGPLPTQLFLHGGGFVLGSSRELINDALLSARAAATGIRFISYEYQLAPEHPYPAARDGSILAFKQLHARAEKYRIDPERLGIGGVSAGGSLAASAALILAQSAGPVPCHLALEVPALSRDLSKLPADLHPAIAAQQAEYRSLLEIYLPKTYHSGPDEFAFIAESPSLAGLPPTLMVLAEFDLVTSGALQLAERLRLQGTPLVTRVQTGQVHGSPGATAVSASSRDWQDFVAAQLRTAYASSRPAQQKVANDAS